MLNLQKKCFHGHYTNLPHFKQMILSCLKKLSQFFIPLRHSYHCYKQFLIWKGLKVDPDWWSSNVLVSAALHTEKLPRTLPSFFHAVIAIATSHFILPHIYSFMYFYWGLVYGLFLIVLAYLTILVLAIDPPWQDDEKSKYIGLWNSKSQKCSCVLHRAKIKNSDILG